MAPLDAEARVRDDLFFPIRVKRWLRFHYETVKMLYTRSWPTIDGGPSHGG
jgi:hypothetical protein